MKIWFISDTHTHHKLLNIPEVDMVIHCGDESNHFNPAINQHEALDFFDWYSNLPIDYKLYIPGNHSTAVHEGLIDLDMFPIIPLLHEMTIIEGISIFGSPYTPSFGRSGAYMRKRNRMQAVWENLPKTDILITHGPPKGILDLTRDKDTKELVQAGCKSLYNKVMELKPKIHAFGHFHQEQGCNNTGIFCDTSNIKFINAACLNHHTQEVYSGHIIEM